MFVAREIKQTLLRKFGKVFFDSPFRWLFDIILFPAKVFQFDWPKKQTEIASPGHLLPNIEMEIVHIELSQGGQMRQVLNRYSFF